MFWGILIVVAYAAVSFLVITFFENEAYTESGGDVSSYVKSAIILMGLFWPVLAVLFMCAMAARKFNRRVRQ